MFIRKSTKATIDWSEKRSSIKESDLITLRLRILALKKLRLYDDSPSSDASMVWERVSAGYRIIDLQLNRYLQALHFVLVHRRPKYSLKDIDNYKTLSFRLIRAGLLVFQTHFCQTEPLFKAVGLYDDAVSVKVFTNKVFEQMEQAISFCALQEGTNDLVGVLVASTFEKSQWFVKKEQGETLHQILLLRNHVVGKARFYEVTNADRFVCVDVLCVKHDHQNNGVGTALLRSCVARASYFATACVGQFTSDAAQTIANRLDFQTLYQLPYEQLSKSRFEIFQACYPENYSIACMAVQLSPSKFQLPITFDSTPTKTRREDYEKRRKANRKE
ncbi:uncharacterized protein LOC122536020 [Frieseomelitta varia]|uniref:uncharacterized protein LOC122536020 n=1 Tax=Frieseomelitta varia TaxID=561572 RepID=UPI001CB6A46A|nr:uncharacterized protein LOC122536020 [Frieseomelitta varia]